MIERVAILRHRVRLLTWLFILGLVVSGATAIPLETELGWLTRTLGINSAPGGLPDDGLRGWLGWIWTGLSETNRRYPFLAYGTDWLAFGHFVIAIAFVGALRDPVRNIWLFQFGMIACALVVPYALVFGALRGIPLYWRLIDCSFGVLGFVPLWLARRWTLEIATLDPRFVRTPHGGA